MLPEFVEREIPLLFELPESPAVNLELLREMLPEFVEKARVSPKL